MADRAVPARGEALRVRTLTAGLLGTQHRLLVLLVPGPDVGEVPAQPGEELLGAQLLVRHLGALPVVRRRWVLERLLAHRNRGTGVVVRQVGTLPRQHPAHDPVRIARCGDLSIQGHHVLDHGAVVAVADHTTGVPLLRRHRTGGEHVLGHRTAHRDTGHTSGVERSGVHIGSGVAVPERAVVLTDDPGHPGLGGDRAGGADLLDRAVVHIGQQPGVGRFRAHLAVHPEVADRALVVREQAGTLVRWRGVVADHMPAAVQHTGERHLAAELGHRGLAQVQIGGELVDAVRIVGEVRQVAGALDQVRVLGGAAAVHPFPHSDRRSERLPGVQAVPDEHPHGLTGVHRQRGVEGDVLLPALVVQAHVQRTQLVHLLLVPVVGGRNHCDLIAAARVAEQPHTGELVVDDVGGGDLPVLARFGHRDAVHCAPVDRPGGQLQPLLGDLQHATHLDVLVEDDVVPPVLAVVVELRPGRTHRDERGAELLLLRGLGQASVVDGGALVHVVVGAQVQVDAELVERSGDPGSVGRQVGVVAVPAAVVGVVPDDDVPLRGRGSDVLGEPGELGVDIGSGVQHREVDVAAVEGVVALPDRPALGQVVHV